MPKKDAHSDLIAEISQIKTTKQHQWILELIHKKQYHKALLQGCQNCNPQDTILTELLAVLIRNRDALCLDVDIKENGLGPIDYTISNQNYTLHFLLEKANANANKFLKPVWMQFIANAVYKIASHENALYKKDRESIDALFKALPSKNSFLTDQENAQFDIKRLICLLHILRHLQQYHNDLNDSSLVDCKLSPFEREVLYYRRIDYIRESINRFSVIISNLSGSLRSRHKAQLEPLSWIILEQLGGATAKTTPEMVFLFALEKTITDLRFDDAENSLFQEHSDREELVEEAIPSVLNELNALDQFFKSLLTKELKPDTPTVDKPLILPNVKAITRYFLETKYLIDLLNLVNYTEGELYDQEKVDNVFGASGIKVLFTTLPPEVQYRRRLDLSTKAGQHALLKRFQRIGELLTGKKSDFTEFDETIDFRALITLRDGICHQDEGNNKFIIDNLLKDKEKLETIASEEMYSLFKRVQKFIASRQKVYGVYQENPKKFWASVLKVEQERFQLAQEKAKSKQQVVVDAPERRIPQQEEDEFFILFELLKSELLKQMITLPNPQEMITECHQIFDGTAEIPSKKRIGEMLQPFAKFKKTEYESQYKRMAQILTNATAKPRTTAVEREQKRLQEQNEAALRRAARESIFIGLDHIRELAKQLMATPVREHTLTPLKRVDAAIEALNNMQEFLLETGYLVIGQPHKDMKSWDLYHARQGHPDLVQLLASNHQLSDALEYNAGQLLQHLDTIKGYAEAHRSKPLTLGYEALRNLRNYIEHGDPLTETQDINLNKNSPHAFHHQKVLAPKIIELIFELLPDLMQIKAVMERNQALQVPASVPVDPLASKEMESSVSVEAASAKKPSPLVIKSIFNYSVDKIEAEDLPDQNCTP
ncbi:hypothetical protein OQJ13_08980 [Legionella sp. PATHC035]|uniref:hypothetical protein n=1 Tax=Legionella sp. PATHC035 TaxID=2992040 RepID=UPI00224477A3|nr:hypothetical protein [Legionella sp. PATHC035]MCW8409103.1 hypothetical protein [Legionella sp. PATHC035]